MTPAALDYRWGHTCRILHARSPRTTLCRSAVRGQLPADNENQCRFFCSRGAASGEPQIRETHGKSPRPTHTDYNMGQWPAVYSSLANQVAPATVSHRATRAETPLSAPTRLVRVPFPICPHQGATPSSPHCLPVHPPVVFQSSSSPPPTYLSSALWRMTYRHTPD